MALKYIHQKFNLDQICGEFGEFGDYGEIGEFGEFCENDELRSGFDVYNLNLKFALKLASKLYFFHKYSSKNDVIATTNQTYHQFLSSNSNIIVKILYWLVKIYNNRPTNKHDQFSFRFQSKSSKKDT